MQSVLQDATRGQIVSNPFPHLMIKPAFPASLYEVLAAEFPDLTTLQDGRPPQANGQCFCDASRVLDNPNVSELWREFFVCHTSKSFFLQVLDHFGTTIGDSHPTLARKGQTLAGLRTSIRNVEPMADVALDCQFVYNPPSAGPKTIRGPHLDRPVALYAGLLYFRLQSDVAFGGDLDLYNCSHECSAVEPDGSVSSDVIEKVATIAYAQNTLVLFPHSRRSVHGVSTREASPLPRLHINLLAEVPAH